MFLIFPYLSTRYRTLDFLIHNSGARQLYHLSEKLNCLLKRDFLKHLPIEMSFYLLKFLDPQSLLSCCQVSKTWNKTVNSCVDCWKRSCDIIGNADLSLQALSINVNVFGSLALKNFKSRNTFDWY